MDRRYRLGHEVNIMKITKRFVAAMLIVKMAWFLSLPAAEAQQSPQGKQWPMRYETGSVALKPGTRVNVTVNPGKIEVKNGKGVVVLSIPVTTVKEVNDETTIENRGRQVIGDGGGGFDGPGGEGAAMVLGADLAAALIMSPINTKKHYVDIRWEEDGAAKEAMFKVGKGEYKAFLADLKGVTGQPARAQTTTQERIQQERPSRVAAVKYYESNAGPADRALRDQAAFVFPVQHDHGGFGSCQGLLYVTWNRIVYDPVYSPGHRRDAFDSLKDRIVEVSLLGLGALHDAVKIVLPNKKTFQFRSIFSGQYSEVARSQESEFWDLFDRTVGNFAAVEAEFRKPNPGRSEP